MTYYTVSEIAEAFATNQETIRRWIRGGELDAEHGSLREGKKVSEASLQTFLSKHPKYASAAAKSPLLGFTASVSLGKAVLERSIKDIGSLKVSDINEWLIIAKEALAKKELEVQQLRENIAVIEAMQKVIQAKEHEGGNS